MLQDDIKKAKSEGSLCTFNYRSGIPYFHRSHYFRSVFLLLWAEFKCVFLAKIAGFIIGVIPQIRNSLIGASAPLHVVEDSASLIGYTSYSETVGVANSTAL
jgi:hypothetical protein